MIVRVQRSVGHICFACRLEYFERDGEVYRAQSCAPVMPDGYRFGRWEGRRSWFDANVLPSLIAPGPNTTVVLPTWAYAYLTDSQL